MTKPIDDEAVIDDEPIDDEVIDDEVIDDEAVADESRRRRSRRRRSRRRRRGADWCRGREYPGSALPDEDGNAPEGFEIKGNAQSMLYHTPDSRYYKATKAEVYFDTVESAEAAGFTAPGSSGRRRPGGREVMGQKINPYGFRLASPPTGRAGGSVSTSTRPI